VRVPRTSNETVFQDKLRRFDRPDTHRTYTLKFILYLLYSFNLTTGIAQAAIHAQDLSGIDCNLKAILVGLIWV